MVLFKKMKKKKMLRSTAIQGQFYFAISTKQTISVNEIAH